ncbi:MAG TPA: 50S ribosomal protein L21e [Candidatus Binatia bacterium]|nr:50S ribosomal protein L21e [Candidatus Binatia bacterium]
MSKRLGGARRRTRRTFAKETRDRGKVRISKYLEEFKTGDKVCLQYEPSVQEGRYFHRYHANIGHIKAKRGDCYEVEIRVTKNKRILLIHPVHLKRIPV